MDVCIELNGVLLGSGMAANASGGNWDCPACGNNNYASRQGTYQYCTRTAAALHLHRVSAASVHLSLPRDECRQCLHSLRTAAIFESLIISMYANLSVCNLEPHSLSAVCNRRTCGLPRPAPGSSPPPAVGDKRGREWSDGAATGSGSAPQRNGDWVCPKCNNLNFSSREVCSAAFLILYCQLCCLTLLGSRLVLVQMFTFEFTTSH